MKTIFNGGVDKYLIALEAYNSSLHCRECGEDNKSIFHYYRTCASGDLYWCKNCKTETITGAKPNEDSF